MGPRPFIPGKEFEHAIERGDLEIAIALARDIATEVGRPIPLKRALELVALAVQVEPDKYDAWALRWLVRWAGETDGSTIDSAVDIAASLAALPVEPEAVETIQRAL